jgi:predicted MFS family arabinose efflux permease
MPELSVRRRWALALIATSTMAVSYMDRQTLSVLGPQVTIAFNISETRYGWLASAFSMAYLVGTPLGGRFIVAVGARRGLLASVLLWSGVAAAHALAPSFAVLFALRIALGLAEAPAFPGAAFTVQQVLPLGDRARGLGILFAGSSVGAMVAPKLVTWLAGHWGWHFAFVGSALVGLAWVPVWLSATAGKAGEVLAAQAAEGAPTTIDWRALTTRPALRRGVAVVLSAAPAAAFALLWGSKYLVRTFHLDPLEVAPYLILPPVLYDVGSIAFGDLASRRTKAGQTDIRDLVLIAAVLTAGVAGIGWAPGPWLGVVAAGLSLGGVSALFTLVTSRALAGVEPHEVPVASGVLAATQSLAYVIASPLIGLSLDRTGDYRVAGVALALWVLPGSLWWVRGAARDPLPG